MPIPVTVPLSPLSVTDGQVARAEQLLTAIVQIIGNGTTGATTNTPQTLQQQDGPNFPPRALILDSPQAQLALRQMAHALALWSSGPTSQYRAVADNTARDAISSLERVEGMLVRTNDSGNFWILAADLTTWSMFTFP